MKKHLIFKLDVFPSVPGKSYPTKGWFLCMALLLIPGSVSASEKLYKSMDESGQIHYSSVPPENAIKTKQLSVQPAPAQEQVREAEQRAAEEARAAAALEEERKVAREQAQAQPKEEPTTETMEPVETTGTPIYRQGANLLPLVPSESPTDGDHPIYKPGIGSRPIARPLPAAR